MTSNLTDFELVQFRWLDRATHVHFGLCGTCFRVHSDAGKPLLVARQPHKKKFECALCFNNRTEES